MATTDDSRCPDNPQASRTDVKVGITPEGTILLRLEAGLLSIDISLNPRQALDLMSGLVEALDRISNRKTTKKD